MLQAHYDCSFDCLNVRKNLETGAPAQGIGGARPRLSAITATASRRNDGPGSVCKYLQIAFNHDKPNAV
jgi:hypothetical protein